MIFLTTEIYVFDNLTEDGTYLAVAIKDFRDVSLLFRGGFVLQNISEAMTFFNWNGIIFWMRSQYSKLCFRSLSITSFTQL